MATRESAKASRPVTVTGLDHVFVNTTKPHPAGPMHGTHEVAQVYEGQDIPAEVSDEEYARLDALGAFGEHPRVEYQRFIDQLEQRGLAQRPKQVGDDDGASEENDDGDSESDGDGNVPWETGE